MGMEKMEDSYSLKVFKRVSSLGNLIIISWITIAGGIVFILTNSSKGWFGIFIGVSLLCLPFTPLFRKYIEKPFPEPAFQILTIVGNILMIAMFAWITNMLLSDPFVMYNESNKLSVILWIGATSLSFVALITNLIVLQRNRKGRNQR